MFKTLEWSTDLSTRMYRIRNGVKEAEPQTAAEAVATHRKGDRYTDLVHMFRLHRSHVSHGPRPHYEFEPRWYTGRLRAGVIK